MPYPDQPVADVTPHLEALFLIADAARPDPGHFMDRLTMAAHREDAPTVMLYLAAYAAGFLRRLHEQNAIPSEPRETLMNLAGMVAAMVPKRE
jgi:hypothetical protein